MNSSRVIIFLPGARFRMFRKLIPPEKLSQNLCRPILCTVLLQIEFAFIPEATGVYASLSLNIYELKLVLSAEKVPGLSRTGPSGGYEVSNSLT